MMQDAAPISLELTAHIVSSYVSRNQIELEDLPALVRSVWQALANLGKDTKESERPIPAVEIKKSVFPDYIVCLEDGMHLTMLKRHLMTSYNMTPDQYRAKWQLPPTYPMVAPNYAKQRSELAKQMGLGRSRLAQQPVKQSTARSTPAVGSGVRKKKSDAK
jgi:predicted transcriptional regulator